MAGYLLAAYGAFAFIRRDVGQYLLLKNHLFFYDASKPLVFFLLDYLAIMWLLAFVAHGLGDGLKEISKGR